MDWGDGAGGEIIVVPVANRTTLRGRLNSGLHDYELTDVPLVGIGDNRSRQCLVEQLVDSIRRTEYPRVILQRRMGPVVADPKNEAFDPLKAAVHQRQIGNNEEAFWLIFLFVHFGRSLRSGWRLARDVYAGAGRAGVWTWPRVSSSPRAFTQWLDVQTPRWKADGVARQFGNHRKYESLNTTADVVESYVKWVGASHSHTALVASALTVNASAGQTFDYFYRSMDVVKRFGRMAKFDYLTMLAKLDLAPIEPATAYLHGATGPLKGARLLYTGGPGADIAVDVLEQRLVRLGASLDVGQQVLEDAVCNWQKHPLIYRHFRG